MGFLIETCQSRLHSSKMDDPDQHSDRHKFKTTLTLGTNLMLTVAGAGYNTDRYEIVGDSA